MAPMFNLPEGVTQVSIGIQARSTSHRFPRKVFELIGSKTILQHILDNCERAIRYLKKSAFKTRLNFSYNLLIPKDDEIKYMYGKYSLEGEVEDVLSRYVQLQKTTNADYIVRITGDCPLIPPFLISKAITLATKNKYDYCSNVHENVRTSIDGFDVEVISKRALEWADKNAKSKAQREHVTLILRSAEIPPIFSIGHIQGNIDLSNIKLSVDTKEDLENVRKAYEEIKRKNKTISSLPGKNMVHRY